MTLGELIERLEELRDDVGADAEVRLMTQPNWPFENSIRGVTTADEILAADIDDGETTDVEISDEDAIGNVVYIVEGGQIGYGSKNAWNLC
jgi:hypothetical protein